MGQHLITQTNSARCIGIKICVVQRCYYIYSGFRRKQQNVILAFILRKNIGYKLSYQIFKNAILDREDCTVIIIKKRSGHRSRTLDNYSIPTLSGLRPNKLFNKSLKWNRHIQLTLLKYNFRTKLFPYYHKVVMISSRSLRQLPPSPRRDAEQSNKVQSVKIAKQ